MFYRENRKHSLLLGAGSKEGRKVCFHCISVDFSPKQTTQETRQASVTHQNVAPPHCPPVALRKQKLYTPLLSLMGRNKQNLPLFVHALVQTSRRQGDGHLMPPQGVSKTLQCFTNNSTGAQRGRKADFTDFPHRTTLGGWGWGWEGRLELWTELCPPGQSQLLKP